MNELIFVVEEAPEGGYTARALGESIFTEADDLTQLEEQDTCQANVRGETVSRKTLSLMELVARPPAASASALGLPGEIEQGLHRLIPTLLAARERFDVTPDKGIEGGALLRSPGTRALQDPFIHRDRQVDHSSSPRGTGTRNGYQIEDILLRVRRLQKEPCA